MTDAVKIQGLREFRAGLKAVDRDLPKALRLAFNSAADVVAADARTRVPHRSGRAAGSVKARSTQTRARVVGGGKRAPYYPWIDFGGRVGPSKGVKRPYIAPHGRYIYAAYFRKKASGEFVDVMSAELVKVARSAGVEVE